MYSFKNDYSEGAHPDILEALLKFNLTQENGYGQDSHCLHATNYIKTHIGHEESDIHFLSGGTQTNLIAISTFLRPHEACIAPITGHIATHEAGAIEATGHKILEVETSDGRLTPELIMPVLKEHHFEHMVKPRMVYISNPTELGTVYSKEALKDLYDFCKNNQLFLYIDGARLGAALMAEGIELTLQDIDTNSDAFFIGGTKMGALLGEALVISNPLLKTDMRYLIKQRGGLLAKGFILGIQFEILFKENLYFDLAKKANQSAQMIAKAFKALGCDFLIDSPTNQIFPILKNSVINELLKSYDFYIWKPIDQNTSAVRLITSFATTEETILGFINHYKAVSGE